MAENPLQMEAAKRLGEARKTKGLFAEDMRECYFFADPNRMRQVTSTSSQQQSRLQDAAELQTPLAKELCQDFVTEIVQTYMPEAQKWCERGPGMFLPPDAWGQIKDQVQKDDKKIFDAIKSSNLYAEIQKSFFPDLAIGTVALWIDRKHPHEPVSALAIPLRELEIALGPNGEIDDRFVVRHTRNCYVESLLPGIELSAELKEIFRTQPDGRTEIRWGFWRLWADTTDECWQHVILVKNEVVHSVELRGEGCCPLLVGRFNPSPDWAWGNGPLLQYLPDFRQVDELAGQKIAAVERNLASPLSYPDDSFAAVEQGLENGYAYPIRPGTEDAIKTMFPPVDMSAGIFWDEAMEKRLRRGFFVDFPEQSGDTPPTLGQWLDEMARAQRRIGTPGLPFWREVPAKIFLRFKYLLEAAGAIMPVKVDGRAVSLMAYNPAQRAAEQQEIATAMQYAQMMGQMFPEEFKMAIDGTATMKLFVDKMRVSNMFKFRDPQAVAAAVTQMAQLVGARHDPGQAGNAAPAQAGAIAA